MLRPLLILAALTALGAAQAQATATQTVTLTIPYVLALSADAYELNTTRLENRVEVIAQARAPLTVHLRTNYYWRLTLRGEDGRTRTLTGQPGNHTLTEDELGLTIRDGERLTLIAERHTPPR